MVMRVYLVVVFLVFSTPLMAQIVVPFEGCSPIEDFDAANNWTFGIEPSTPAHSWVWAAPNKAEITDDITGGGKAILLGGNGPNTHYNDDEDSWAMSPEYDLSASNNPYLDFYFYHSNENSTNFDEIWMEYSINGGTTWNVLSPDIGTNNCYDQNWYNFLDNWGGASAAATNSSSTGTCNFGGGIGPTDWLHVRKCIIDLANESSVFFRFRVQAGDICNFWGAAVDNFQVCDAHIDANADFTCTANDLEVMFLDLTEGCVDGWSWDFGDGNTSTQQNPTHAYATAGTYTVELTTTASLAVTAGCGGPYTDTYQFDIEVLDVTAGTINQPVCDGIDNGSITVNVSGNTGSVNYSWTPTTVSGQGTANINNLGEGNYTLTVTPGNPGCPAELSTTLTYDTELLAGTIIADESCQGECDGSIVVNNVVGGTTPYSYTWNNNISTTNTASDLCPGNFTVTIEDDNGCTVTLTPSVTAGPGGNVSADFTITDSVYFYDAAVTPIPDEAGGSWSASCGACIDQNTGTFDPNIAGVGAHQICYVQGSGNCQNTSCEIIIVKGCDDATYFDTITINEGESVEIHDTIRTEEGQYTATFNSQYNCDSTSVIYLNVLVPFNPVFPNVFTPNGDGDNETIYILGDGFESYTCAVFNRWGTKVNTFNNAGSWDGKNQKGKEMPTGVYYGLAEFELSNGEQKTVQFYFHLVRE